MPPGTSVSVVGVRATPTAAVVVAYAAGAPAGDDKQPIGDGTPGNQEKRAPKIIMAPKQIFQARNPYPSASRLLSMTPNPYGGAKGGYFGIVRVANDELRYLYIARIAT